MDASNVPNCVEVWKSIPDYEGLYEISNLGRVKSLPRLVAGPFGSTYTTKERILTPQIKRGKRPRVALSKDGVQIPFPINNLVDAVFWNIPYVRLPAKNEFDLELVDELIVKGKTRMEICAQFGWHKAFLNRKLLTLTGLGYKAYVDKLVGEYSPPTSVKHAFTRQELDSAILKYRKIDAVGKSLGLFKSSITKLSRHFGFKSFADHKATVLRLVNKIPNSDLFLYEGKVLTLVSLGYTVKGASELCGIDYDRFRWYFIGKYNVPMGIFVKGLQGKRHFEMHERKEYRQAWMAGNVKQKLAKRISTSILKCLGKAKIQNTSWILKNELGYTIDDLKAHLENQFDANMTWDNHGTYWHIDHRTPVTWFTYHSSSCKGFKQCWALSNLQPKEAIANIRKGNRWAD